MYLPSLSPAARRFQPWLAVPLIVLCSALSTQAAKPPAAAGTAGTDLFADNGGFEKPPAAAENYWDGVTSDGSIACRTFSAKVVTERGEFGNMAMPPTVSWVDLNGDGRPDLVVADPNGYFRFYPNSGTATEPRFTSAEVIPIFVSLTTQPREVEWRPNDTGDDVRMCPRAAIADWRRSGLLDMLIGDYYGDLFFLPNAGTARAPVYKVPAAGVKGALVATNDQGRYWGNLFAPVACEMTGGGKPDLLMGEGTYSANAIHLLENLGNDTPKFSSAKHSLLIYGDGREQLIPTVADFNGDGLPDVVVADRTGEVGMYLGTGKPAANTEFKRSSTLTFGGTAKLGGVNAPCAADFNGDGLMDLLIGTPNGHVAVSLNTGTKTEPKFGPLVELKGTPRLGRNLKTPTGWHLNTWANYGNALAYISVVGSLDDPDSKPPEGNNCLKAGYSPLPAQTFPMPDTGMPGGSHHFTFNHDAVTVSTNKSYRLSFKVKGAGMEKMRYLLETRYRGFPTVDKVEQDERGVSKHASALVEEWVELGSTFTAGSNWATVEGTLLPRYKNPALKDEATMSVRLFLDFYSTGLASQLYFDDFHLVEQ